jgi:hypothetical protein
LEHRPENSKLMVVRCASKRHRRGRAGRHGAWQAVSGVVRLAGLRGLLLLPAGALVLDRLRYLLAYRSDAGQVFAEQGHAYLAMLFPAIAALVALAAVAFTTRLASAWRGAPVVEAAPAASAASLWGASAAALLSIHLVQETLEALLIPGNTGLHDLAGPQALCALLAALLTGGLLALVLRGARTFIVRAAGRSRPSRAPRGCTPSLWRRRHIDRRILAPLARSAAGRAPPAFAA